MRVWIVLPWHKCGIAQVRVRLRRTPVVLLSVSIVLPTVKKIVLALPAVLALAACGTASAAPPARPAAFTAATRPLWCHAVVSNPRPARYTTTLVHVQTQASVKVFTVAFFKTVHRAYFAHASTDGRANVTYHVSGATYGRRVPVVVTVVQRQRAATCTTSFTPRRRRGHPGPPTPSPTRSSPAPRPSASSPSPRPPHSSPPTSPPPAGCYPRASTGNCYRAGEYCPEADHGMHGIDANGNPIICEDNDGWRWESA